MPETLNNVDKQTTLIEYGDSSYRSLMTIHEDFWNSRQRLKMFDKPIFNFSAIEIKESLFTKAYSNSLNKKMSGKNV